MQYARFRCAAAAGAAIADGWVVGISMPSPRVDVVHIVEPDEWCVTVDGERVLTFSGPSAWTNAVSHRAELHELLTQDAADASDNDQA